MKKIKSEGKQLFSIPNNEEGLAFLQSCKKYLNTKRYKFSKRGRGPRGSKWSKGYNSHISLRKSDSAWFAVYAEIKKTEMEEKFETDRGERVSSDNNSMQLTIMNLERELATIRSIYERSIWWRI